MDLSRDKLALETNLLAEVALAIEACCHGSVLVDELGSPRRMEPLSA
jgi:hypothetical protein